MNWGNVAAAVVGLTVGCLLAWAMYAVGGAPLLIGVLVGAWLERGVKAFEAWGRE